MNKKHIEFNPVDVARRCSQTSEYAGLRTTPWSHNLSSKEDQEMKFKSKLPFSMMAALLAVVLTSVAARAQDFEFRRQDRKNAEGLRAVLARNPSHPVRTLLTFLSG